MITENYYKTLRLKNFASLEEIKSQYKKLMKTHHPDKGGEAETFIEIQFAYDCLLDSTKKEELDERILLDEEIYEKSEELDDYEVKILSNNKESKDSSENEKVEGFLVEFLCLQCQSKNKIKLSLNESIKNFLTIKLVNRNTSINKLEENEDKLLFKEAFSLIKGVLLECMYCSLKYKIVNKIEEEEKETQD